MKLDTRQTRNLLLADTTPIPTPFPNTGTISLSKIGLTYHHGDNAIERDFLTVIEYCDNAIVSYEMLREYVHAVFIHGEWVDAETFHISSEPWVDDLEQGEWFLGPDITEEKIRTRLKRPEGDISTRDSILRGIAFVVQGRPILKNTEVALTAGAWEEELHPCCCCCKRISSGPAVESTAPRRMVEEMPPGAVRTMRMRCCSC